MSTPRDSAKRVFNEANECLYDAYESCLPSCFRTEPPWPEWNDADINSETWGNGVTRVKPQTTKSLEKSDTTIIQVASYYTDPEPGSLPTELQKFVASWKRPDELFPADALTVYNPNSTSPAFRSSSPDSSACEFFKGVSDVCCLLQYHAAMEPFPVEMETPTFVSNTKGQPWQPWHHVYGKCRAGKDQPHRPVYHPYGKYYVRLFYLGAWRKFTVDDMIPCDAAGKPLLPLTQTPGELWSVLLVKALLKIASLTSTTCLSLVDLPMWTLFTGWTFGRCAVASKTVNQVWRFIYSLSPNFTLPEDKEKSTEVAASTTPSTSSKKPPPEKRTTEAVKAVEEIRPVLMIAELQDLLDKTVQTAVLMTRDIPLVKAKARKTTERWKRVRWVYWAAKKGLWTDEQLIPTYRCLHLLNMDIEMNKVIRTDPDIEKRLFVMDETNAAETESDPTSPVQWIDFYKFYNHLSKLTYLVKPSAMTAKCRMTYLTQSQRSSSASTKSKTVSESSAYHMLPSVKFSNNEPPLLFVESMTGIFFIFSLWVCPTEPVNGKFHLADDMPEYATPYNGSLVIERHDWRSARQNAVIAMVKTVGNDTTWFYLNPGRHALKIWLDTDSPFIIDIYSNSEFTVGGGPKIRFHMLSEAIGVSDYVNRLSMGFIDLVQKFGRPNHAENLSEFYRNVCPRRTMASGYYAKLKVFVDAVSVSIATLVKSMLTNDDELLWMVKALRALFVNPNIPVRGQKLQPQQKKKMIECSTSNTALETYTEKENHSATTIQRIFRGHYVRELARYRSPTSREFKVLQEKLKRICELVFAPNKRDNEVARLIRETVTTSPANLETFVFYRDVPNVIVVEEFTGKIPGVEPKAWVPMIRFMFACHSNDPLPCAFYHSCNVASYTVTVTDNDTGEEVFRLVNSTCPQYYTRNVSGYTLFVYGWNDSEIKTVNWRLEMVKMKYFLEIHPCNTSLIPITGNQCNPYQPQPLAKHELKNFYIPNKRNRICKCLLKVRKRLQVTVRLAVSFDDVRFYARIYDKRNEMYTGSDVSLADEALAELETVSSAIIFTSIILDHTPKDTNDGKEDPNDWTVYVVDAFVIHNSWPLTKHEWGVVEPIRVNGETWQDTTSSMNVTASRKSSTGSRKRSMRSSKTGIFPHKVVESPYWHLQVVTEASSHLSNALELVEDVSHHEAVRRMKLSWEESDPGRRNRGKAIQREFLKTAYNEMLESKKVNAEADDNLSDHASSVRLIESETTPGEDGFESFLHQIRSFSYLLDDKTEARSLKSPRVLPWVPTNELNEKYSRRKDDSDRITTSQSFDDVMPEYYVPPIIRFKSYDSIPDEWMRMLLKMSNQNQVIRDLVARETNLSAQLMEEAYEDRSRAIEKMKLSSRFVRTDTK